MRILGLDPGLATGLAIYNTASLRFEHMEETANGIKGFPDKFLERFSSVYYPVSFMCCEKFTLRSSNEFVADLSGVEIIGWLKGEGYWGKDNPEPSQHMTLTRLRKNKDKYQDSKITHMMKRDGFKIGEGHTRMAGSVAVWFAAKVLKHEPTLRMLSGKD